MAKRALKVATFKSEEERTLSVRLPTYILEHISQSIINRGMGKKGRSKWFSEAFVSLGEMARNDHEGYITSLMLYNNTKKLKQIQISVKGDELKEFENLLKAAAVSTVETDGMITRLVLMSAHLQLMKEGIIVL